MFGGNAREASPPTQRPGDGTFRSIPGENLPAALQLMNISASTRGNSEAEIIKSFKASMKKHKNDAKPRIFKRPLFDIGWVVALTFVGRVHYIW